MHHRTETPTPIRGQQWGRRPRDGGIQDGHGTPNHKGPKARERAPRPRTPSPEPDTGGHRYPKWPRFPEGGRMTWHFFPEQDTRCAGGHRYPIIPGNGPGFREAARATLHSRPGQDT